MERALSATDSLIKDLHHKQCKVTQGTEEVVLSI